MALIIGTTILLMFCLFPTAVNGDTKSDTVTVDAGEKYSTTFRANSGELMWEVSVHGDFYSGEYANSYIDMEIWDNVEDELVYYLIDVGNDTGTQQIWSDGGYRFSLKNDNEFPVEIYYHLEYDHYSLPVCCGGIVLVPMAVLIAIVLVLTFVKRRSTSNR